MSELGGLPVVIATTGEFKMSTLHAFSRGPSPLRMSGIVGTNVVDHKNQSLGGIVEILLDPHYAMVGYAVISLGDAETQGKLLPVPFSALKFRSGENHFVLNMSRERLKSAPQFEKDHWPTMSDENWNREIHRFYDRPPYWE